MERNSSMNIKAKLSQCEQFAVDNLAECAAEMVEWQDKTVLRDGKVRHLARMIEEWAGRRDSLQLAKHMVERAALKACASEFKR